MCSRSGTDPVPFGDPDDAWETIRSRIERGRTVDGDEWVEGRDVPDWHFIEPPKVLVDPEFLRDIYDALDAFDTPTHSYEDIAEYLTVRKKITSRKW